MDVIIYHKSCPDGWCSALIAKRRYPNAKLIGMDHGPDIEAIKNLIADCAGLDVLMVDYSFRTRYLNLQMHAFAKSFKIFDHHKTAKEQLEGLDFAVFDMERSGAGITWDELFGKIDLAYLNDRNAPEIDLGDGRKFIGMPQPIRPWYVDYVQDRDLWKHNLPSTREINAYIMTLPFDEVAWRALEKMTPRQAATLGEGALAHVNHYVREIVKHQRSGEYYFLKTGRVYSLAILNAPYLNISEVGNVLASDYADIGMGWFERGDGIIQFSLRSNGNIDVSEIATHFGGGGHKNAAGFQMSIKQGREFIDSLILK